MKILDLTLCKEHESKTKDEVIKLVEQEVDKFSQFMAGLGEWKSAGPLIPQERILIQSYLIHKLRGHIDS